MIMKLKTIEILVRPSGELQVEAMNFTGMDCEKATAFLEAALGQVSERRRKPEYFCRAQRQQIQKVRA